MSKNNGTRTQSYARLHKRGLTLPQQSAVDLLASGKNDTETAKLLNLSRVAVTRWRLHDPTFIAELNARRAAIWAVGADRLRTLIPKALDVLAELLERGDDPLRLKAADTVLRLAQLPGGAAGIGPQDAEEVVRQIVTTRRQAASRPLDSLEILNGLPSFDQHIEDVWGELDALANGESEGQV